VIVIGNLGLLHLDPHHSRMSARQRAAWKHR
jgi:hypothetical protein